MTRYRDWSSVVVNCWPSLFIHNIASEYKILSGFFKFLDSFQIGLNLVRIELYFSKIIFFQILAYFCVPFLVAAYFIISCTSLCAMDSSRARTKRRRIRRDLDLLRSRLRNVEATVAISDSSTDTAILNNEIHFEDQEQEDDFDSSRMLLFNSNFITSIFYIGFFQIFNFMKVFLWLGRKKPKAKMWHVFSR